MISICSFTDATFGGKIRRGNSYYHKKNYEKALESYRQAEIKKPDSPLVHYNLGNAHYKQENFEEASLEYKKSLNLKNKIQRANSYYNLGNAYVRLEKIDEAINSYKEALRLNPKDEDARHNLRYLLKLKQHPQQKKKGGKSDQKEKEEKSEQQKQKQQEKQMSKEDVERLLQIIKDQERDAINKKLKPKLPKLPTVEKDW